MIIEETKGLATMTIDEPFGSLITHENTLQMDEEMEINKKKKKDLALRILTQKEDEVLDEEMTPLTTNFKKFFKKKQL